MIFYCLFEKVEKVLSIKPGYLLLTEYEMTNSVIPNSNFSVFPPVPSNTAARFRMLINSEPTITCPLLGLKDDPETLSNFASADNYCHCKGHPRSVPLDYQQMYCLLGYARCPGFLKRMATEVHAQEQTEKEKKGVTSRTSAGMVGLLINLLGIK